MEGSTQIPDEVMDLLRQASTGMVADALAMAGVDGGIPSIRPARGFENAKVIGPAVTVEFGPPLPDGPNLNNYRAIAQSLPGSVFVIDGKGYDGHFTGDNQGQMAKQQGLAGMVVYGGARDLAGYRQMGMPLYCTGSATRDKPADFQIVGFNTPLNLGGVTVLPGDIIVAGEDGVVAIPADGVDALMRNLWTVFEVEAAMEAAMLRGEGVDEISMIAARKKPRRE